MVGTTSCKCTDRAHPAGKPDEPDICEGFTSFWNSVQLFSMFTAESVKHLTVVSKMGTQLLGSVHTER